MTEPFDFKKDVVDLSFIKPVLIDFWAPWCGPCKILGPILENLEAASNGAWALVKLNTEEYPEIASYFKIQSIPHCKLIFEGKIADEFTGAESKATIEKWLEKNLSALMAEEIDAEPDDYESLVSEQLNIPDEPFMQKLQRFVEANPDHQRALTDLVKHEIFYFPSKAISRIEHRKDQKEMLDLYEDLTILKEFISYEYPEDSVASKLLATAKKEIVSGNGAGSIEHLIEAVTKEPAYQKELARRTGIALFHIWGNSNPLTKEYRKLFDMAIY
ncbi:MAG: tetratricopeptide repeat protein [Bacteroidota bacterium]|nr:tetratricopeptide repeat protein [Bacteroidota bacterium]